AGRIGRSPRTNGGPGGGPRCPRATLRIDPSTAGHRTMTNVRDFLRDNPDSLPTSADAPRRPLTLQTDPSSDEHPMNRGLLQAHVGSLVVFMYVDDPAHYFLDMFGKYPASEAQAIAAFGREAVAQHKREAEDRAVDKRIAQAVGEAVAA